MNRKLLPAAAVTLCIMTVFPRFASAQVVNATRSETKSSDSLRSVFKAASSQANKSTVMVKMDDAGTMRQVALGTIVSPDGYILTKGSEVARAKLLVSLMSGDSLRYYDAKVVGLNTKLDLGMLKIDAKGLIPINFSDTRPGLPDAVDNAAAGAGGAGFTGGPPQGAGRGNRGRGRNRTVVMPVAATAPAPPSGAIAVTVGEWVASANPEASLKNDSYEEPFAVGVISVARRRIAPLNGFLGVIMEDTTDNTGTRIQSVQDNSPADHAGVRADDLITAVNGTATPNRLALRATVQKLGPGETVTLSIARGEQTLTLRATLGIATGASAEEANIQHQLTGEINLRSGDFPAVFQHDTVIRSVDCGGPIVDLDGHVLGINIARAGRTETYAIPADLIIPVIQPLESGKMAPAATK